jgi:hypothetical protein
VLEIRVHVLTWQTKELVCHTIMMRPEQSLKFPFLMLTAGPTGTLATAGMD